MKPIRFIAFSALCGTCLLPLATAQSPPIIDFPSPLLLPLTGRHEANHSVTVHFPGDAINPPVQLRDFRLGPPPALQTPPSPGTAVIHTFVTTARAALAFGAAGAFQPVDFEAQVTLQVTANVAVGSYDTEMLMLNLQGNTPNGPIAIRESPTLASTGATTMKNRLDGSYRIDSFFDIFTELSLDSGANWTPADAACRCPLAAPSAENSFSSPNLPPKGPIHTSTGATFGGIGVVIRNLAVRDPINSLPPPPPGGSQTHTTAATATGEVSGDNGISFQPFACTSDITERVTSLAEHDDVRYFDTEMLQLNLFGGSLPTGFMLRESPTKSSTGRTSLRQAVDNHYRISSFFDIFTEVSLDGGATWSPATSGACVCALAARPPEYFFTNDCYPPPAEFVSERDASVSFGSTGVVFRRFTEHPVSRRAPLPAAGTQQNYQVQSETSLEVSRDGGATFIRYWIITLKEVMVSSFQTAGSSGGNDYPQESLSLNFSLPGGIMVRESPTKASLGRTTVRSAPGGYMMGSFFDVFTEVSLDGGATWTPADQPLHSSLLPYLEAENVFKHTFQPPRDGSLEMRRFAKPVSCANGTHIRNLKLGSFATTQAPPDAACDPQTQTVACTAECEVSTDDGGTWAPVTCDASVTVHIGRVPAIPDADGVYYDTEMLALNLSGGNLPPSLHLRESPTKASMGRTNIRALATGGYRIDSFFDIFTEISVDGGGTWTPAPEPAELVMRAKPTACFSRSNWVTPALEYRSNNYQVMDWGGDCILSGISLGAPRRGGSSIRLPQPAPGTSAEVNLSAPAEFDLSLDGGATTTRIRCEFKAVCKFSDLTESSSSSSMKNECTQLEFSGTNLPTGFQLRESPTRASTGRTSMRTVPGGYRIDSFFDIFTEVSLDGGASWTPLCSPLHLEATETPGGQLSSSGTQLPPARLVSPPEALSARCATGKHFTDVVLRVNRTNTAPVLLPSPGHTTTAFDTGDVEFLYSTDDGATFTPVHAEAFFRYEMENTMISGYSLFDTEMLQLEFSGGTMPAGMRLRESPTRPSKGRTSLSALPDGQFVVDSFFDVFTEISLDDGRTWEPFDQPLFYQFEDCLVTSEIPSPVWPPPGQLQQTPGDPDFDLLFQVAGTTGFVDIDLDILNFSTPAGGTPMPGPGASVITNALGTCALRLTQPGGAPPLDCTAAATMVARHTHAGTDTEGRSFFDTEMLQLDLAGGTLPAGVQLRESPTKASLGRTSLRAGGGGGGAGGFLIDSFFDIFTEVSLDGGASWAPADATLRLEFARPEIVVENSVGIDLTDNESVIDFGVMLSGTESSRSIVIRNTGTADLTGLSFSITGPNSDDFSAPTGAIAPIRPKNPEAGFITLICLGSVGTRTATLHIASNDNDENTFDIALTARVLSPNGDEDNDGLTNAQELARSGCGFDPVVENSSLLESLRGDGFYRATDMHSLALGRPVLARDPATGAFHLSLGVLKSNTLTGWAPLLGFTPTHDPATGRIDLEIEPDGSGAEFYRVFGEQLSP